MDEMLDKMGAPIKWIGYKSIHSFLNTIQFSNHAKRKENIIITLYCCVTIVRFLLCFMVDIKCEMDLLQCQKIRKLTTLYRQLKAIGPKIDRIEFLSELHMVLMDEEPYSTLLDEVLK